MCCKKLPDSIILDGIVNKNDKIICYIYEKLLPSVKRYILQNNGTASNAEDIFQEALIQIYIKLRNGKVILTSSFSTYFISICKNLWLYQLRKKRNQVLEFADEMYLTSIESTPACVIDTNFTQLFFKHFHRQSKKNQIIISMHFKKVPASEIALKMGLKNKEYAISKKYKSLKRLISDIKSDPELQHIILEDERVELF